MDSVPEWNALYLRVVKKKVPQFLSMESVREILATPMILWFLLAKTPGCEGIQLFSNKKQRSFSVLCDFVMNKMVLRLFILVAFQRDNFAI